MTFNEAIAVYLYLQYQPPRHRDERKFNQAWDKICEYAAPAMKREIEKTGSLLQTINKIGLMLEDKQNGKTRRKLVNQRTSGPQSEP
jgi:hypothetical protein